MKNQEQKILFRGKLPNGVWVYGDLVQNGGAPVIICIGSDEKRTIDNCPGDDWRINAPAYRVDPGSVGQYTGLIDRNRKRIFTGDIVKIRFAHKSNRKKKWKVVYWNGGFAIKAKGHLCSLGSYFTDCDENRVCYDIENPGSLFKIIGNVTTRK